MVARLTHSFIELFSLQRYKVCTSIPLFFLRPFACPKHSSLRLWVPHTHACGFPIVNLAGSFLCQKRQHKWSGSARRAQTGLDAARNSILSQTDDRYKSSLLRLQFHPLNPFTDGEHKSEATLKWVSERGFQKLSCFKFTKKENPMLMFVI